MDVPQPVTYVVEHLDPELGPWSALEYGCIACESRAAGARFLLSSVPTTLEMPEDLAAMKGLEIDHRSIEDRLADRKSTVCLLDPAARVDLSPADAGRFNFFLFGGILGGRTSGPKRRRDGHLADLQWHVSGDDPPRGMNLLFFSCSLAVSNIEELWTDRTSELRKKGYVGRRLGSKQMTTDTAVRVTRIVVQERSACHPSIHPSLL